MNQTPSLQKLRSIMSLLLNSNTRLQLAQYKNTIKTILEQAPSNSSSVMDSIFQQFLAYCVHSKRATQILCWIEENTEIFVKYSKNIGEIAKRYIQISSTSNMDQENGKEVRLFLTKKILEDSALSDNLIQICKSDQETCAKFLALIQQYFKEKKVAGNVTGLVILCINLLKYYQHISSKNIRNCLSILNYLIKSSQILQKSILLNLTNDIQQILKSSKAQKQSIQFCTSFIKFSNNQELSLQYIENVLTMIRNSIKNNSSQVLYQKRLSIPVQYSVAITQFLQIASIFLKQLQLPNTTTPTQPKPKNRQKNLIIIDEQSSLSQNTHKNLKDSLISLCKDLLLIVDCESVGRLFEILSDVRKAGDYKLYFGQCLTNCMVYHIGRSQKQELILSFVFLWLGNMGVQEKNNIKLELGFQPQNISQYPEPTITLFIDYIKKTIQNQFQFQFNRNSVQAACNLFCYLSGINDSDWKKKQSIMQVVKMLLNLNQSCQKEFREFLVQKIVKIICVYGKELLVENGFLVQVLEDKLLENIFKHKKEVIYMIQNKFLTERFTTNLIQKLQTPFPLQLPQKQLQFLFDVLATQNKQKLMNNTYNLSWQWTAYIHNSGIKIYGREWVCCDRQLKQVRENKMGMYPIQFWGDQRKMERVEGLRKV